MNGEARWPAPTVLLQAAARFGTPLYVTDLAALDAAAATLRAAFPDPFVRSYSLKANDVPAVVARLTADGTIGANVVSRGEWWLARRAGVPNERITLEGIGKSEADLRAAVQAAADGHPLRWIAVESIDESEARGSIARRARRAGRLDARLAVLLRLNPEVAPETLPGLAVGSGRSKFGLGEAELAAAIEAGGGPGGPLAWRGLHLHVGSQLGAVDAWRDAARRGLNLLALWRGALPDFDTLDLGGGFPVGPLGTPMPGPARFARELGPLLEAIPPDRRPTRLAVEPGRFLVARAGILLARVLHVRRRPDGAMAVLDAGMTELIRPALYGARHGIAAVTSLGRPEASVALPAIDSAAADRATSGGASAGEAPTARPPLGGASVAGDLELTRVEGPICESTDALGEHLLPPLRRGDLVAILDAGAYGSSLSSRYNGRPRPAEVLLGPGGSIRLARRRGSIASLA
jgi:diaminopimelate decarboxylase